MPELTIGVCGIVIRLSAVDRRFVASAARRYASFVSRAEPDLFLDLTLVRKKLRRFLAEPRVVWDGRAGRIERHDLELDLVPGLARAVLVRGLSPLDSLLRIVLSFELAKRGGFLCHSAAIDGWLLPGLSGAGKSTLGKIVPKSRLLADELVGVRGTTLYGTPFRGDFLAGRNNVSHPLKALLLLDRHAPRGVHPASKAAALMRLLQCVLYFGNDLRGGRRLLAAAKRCVSRARTFVLSYDARRTPFSRLDALIREALR